MKLNTRKLGAFVIISSVLGSLTIAFQNFTVNESEGVAQSAPKKEPSLHDAISAALKTAEADTTAKQIALSVEPSQIEQASLRKNREPRAIVDNTQTLTETDPTWASKETEEHPEVEDSVADEVNDSGAP